jgi:hypothetical protein
MADTVADEGRAATDMTSDGVRWVADAAPDSARRASDMESDSVRITADTRSDDARWMTFAELAAARGISRASASRLVRRRKWRRQSDNQGNVRILVPPEDSELADSPLDIVQSLESTFREQVEHERKRAENAEARADRTLALLAEANTDRAAAVTRAERAEALIANLETDVATKEEVAAQLRAECDRARQHAREAEDAIVELRQAEAARRGQGRWARIKAAWRGN